MPQKLLSLASAALTIAELGSAKLIGDVVSEVRMVGAGYGIIACPRYVILIDSTTWFIEISKFLLLITLRNCVDSHYKIAGP